MTTPKTVHGLFLAVKKAVEAKGMPFVMEYGPAQVPSSVGPTRVIFQRERGVGETLKAPTGTHRNPGMVARRGLPILVRIFAMSTVQGAGFQDHEQLALQVSEQILVEVHRAVRSFGTEYALTFSGLVDNAPDAKDWKGVTHEIRFTVDDGVMDVSWKGEAAAQGSPASVSNTRTVNGGTAPTDMPSATTRTESS